MSLRSQILHVPETLADMDQACELRWREGDRLYASEDYNGAVYLLGYVIEIRLKLAAFRLLRAGNLDPVHIQRRRINAWMRRHAPHIAEESGHSVLYWANFIQLYRASIHLPVSRDAFRGLRRHVLSYVHNEWKVEMRYRDAARKSDDAWKMWTAAWWIEEHWLKL